LPALSNWRRSAALNARNALATLSIAARHDVCQHAHRANTRARTRTALQPTPETRHVGLDAHTHVVER
jgi:hypothetical protein